MIKVLIVDDELRARNVLQYHIRTFVPEISEIREACSVQEAKEILDFYAPDIVFLDIEMPNQNGFELFDAFPDPDFDVIFTTAYNKYAIQAVQFSALGFLLKPLDPDELIRVVKRHQKKRDLKKQKKQLHDNFLRKIEKREVRDFRLAVPSNSGVFFFSTHEILRLEADRNYTIIHFTDKRPFLASKTLKHFENVLEQSQFLRTHKSHLVNLDHVVRISNNSEFIILRDGSRVEVSRRKKDELQYLLNMR
ncbi:Sensory transduction protein LytR [Dyadobacter sp. CECT 9623]|uniref:Sensory transduction protein LytR n=1 Tax=Dyadobacter linearis TaxID=2823330 RepID=A0ABM8UKB3_9BACT|nr:LytTR family DNA-binding domain-containing protein [Dyadobacter sp. CECT 9623]CAG5067910.1 Sensory transduction protein LytR [Dyadobacter sp. CECT 9623]